VVFYVEDLEDAWTFQDKFDFIFSRAMTGSIGDWPKFFSQSFEWVLTSFSSSHERLSTSWYRFLNPGGVIELADIVYPLQCDDDSLPDNSALLQWTKYLLDGMAAFQRPIDTALKYEEQLAEVGFVDIAVIQHKWPTNRWPKDPKHKELGEWGGTAWNVFRLMCQVYWTWYLGMWNCENFLFGLTGFSLAMFTRPKEEGGLGWSLAEMEVFLAEVRKELRNPRIHAYWPMYDLASQHR
jgi:hypothetical protein